jgi:hypothetical protein
VLSSVHMQGAGSGDDPEEFIVSAMKWHFSPETGSRFWLERKSDLEFDPLRDVRNFTDLSLFPDVVDELRYTRVEDLIPRGCGHRPDVVGVYESGGTTGSPKRVPLLREWRDTYVGWSMERLDEHGFPRDVNWLGIMPTGPHIVSDMIKQQAKVRDGMTFRIDMDPRWVKRSVVAGRLEDAEAYVDHLLEQAVDILITQDVGVLVTTPPLLDRICRRDDIVELINSRVRGIMWTGAHMDADSRLYLREEVFTGIPLYGVYGSTMVLGASSERPSLDSATLCIFDTCSPVMTFSVVDPASREPVGFGERGRVVMNYVGRGFFLPNNLERDYATRVHALPGAFGDSVQDVSPAPTFGGEIVIEGVY